MKQFWILLGLLMPIFLQAQSGWTRAPKSWLVKFDVSHFSSDRYYNPTGNVLITNVFRQTSFNIYGEYGLLEKLTLLVQAPLLRLNSFETTRTVAGVGDLRLEAKYRLTGHQFPVSISVAPEIPTGRANANAQNKTSPIERINLPTGDGEWNVWTTLAASKSWGKWYSSAFTAYNFRTEYDDKKFRDLYQFGAEIGYHPWRPLWLNAKLRAQFSNGDSQHPDLAFVRGDATTYTLFSTEALYKLSRQWSISVTYLTGNEWIVRSQNIYIAPFFSLGVMYER